MSVGRCIIDLSRKEITLDNQTTCDFCSNDWIGYVQVGDEFPWVCETHWDIYATK